MSKIKNTLSSLKDKLNNLNTVITQVEEKEKIVQSLESRIEKILNDSLANDKRVILNIGGNKFETSVDVITKDTRSVFFILYDELKNEFYGRQVELFFDRNSKYFETILTGMRFTPSKMNLKYLDKSELQLIYDEITYYELSDLLLYVEDIMYPTKYKRIDFKIYKHDGFNVGNNDHSYLLSNDSKTGICTDKPGSIILDFANEFNSSEIVSIECKAYHGNKEFYPGNGANALISISSDGVKWEQIGYIPDKFINEIAEVKISVPTTQIKVRHIKIESGSYIGLSYFKVNI